ncbi:MAG: oligoendopeptidase F [Clostridiales bacterium]|nr:oligoendopeptidase F [Clostridiales bacterium]
MRKRTEIPEEYKWQFTDLFASPEDWQAAYDACAAAIPSLTALKGTLSQSAESLLKAYDTVYAFQEKMSLVGSYAFLGKAIDGGDTASLARADKFEALSVKTGAALSFFEPELMAIPPEKLDEFLGYAPLAKYAHIIADATRLRDHVLDEKSERLLAAVRKITATPSNTYKMFTNVEMKLPKIVGEDGQEAELTAGNFSVYRESGKKEVRDAAFKAMFGTYGDYKGTFASVYGGSVKQDNLFAALRGYPSARAASLANANVPEKVYDALIEAIHDAVPSMRKYLELRKKVLGLDTLDVYDLYCPMVADIDYPMPYEEAKKIVLEAVKPLGKDYQAVIARAYRENWIDVYETPGKESGAFSAGVYGVHPFVKLNYTDTLDDAFTLAHELGHAMHSYLSSEKQDFANHGYKLLVAEVASTVNEVLLTKYLLSVETDPKRRAYILNHFLEGFRTTVFRQTLFAEFEYKVHEAEQAGTPLTADFLCGLYKDLEAAYYPNAALRDEIRYEWSYIPHFYRAFYVYVYATGFCSAVYLASRIFETGDAQSYLAFLSTGGSDYPIKELKIAGVDLTSPAVVAGAMKEFDRTIDELAKLFA